MKETVCDKKYDRLASEDQHPFHLADGRSLLFIAYETFLYYELTANMIYWKQLFNIY